MIEHYNAFISYKHAPEDNKVAEAVHRGLERFHIPGKIQKKTGIKRINRIFRDKDELPITNDLSDTIAKALEDSDYLIVICSTNTKQSAWVPREIEYFLKNHTKREIFTVLVNGEPFDVIPEVLLYEDRIVKDENGGEQTVRMPMEPLSCDYRMPLSKAKKTELPRLASGLIGCAYDELMNRRRQYRMKQLTAGFSAALALTLGFSGYMYYSRDQIRRTYLESLKNQSRYLANESGNLLEKEQRITALQLALEALPKDEADERPITAEAVKALTDATLAYESNNGTNIGAAWNYRMPGVVADFRVSEDGSSIAIMDEGSVVGVWNTETHEQLLYEDGSKEQLQGMRFFDNDVLILWTEHSIAAYNVKQNKQLWEYADESSFFSDKYHLMMDGQAIYLHTYEGAYLKLDPKSGKLLDTIPLSFPEGYEEFSPVEGRLSPDGKMIAFRGLGGWNNYAYGVLDLATGQTKLSDYTQELVKDLAWTDNETFVVASTSADMKSSMATGEREILSSDHSSIRCIHAADLSEAWSSDFICNGVSLESGFMPLGTSEVAYYSGNVISVYDKSTGTEKYKSNVNDSVIDVSDRDQDGVPACVTENGGYALPALSVDQDAVYYTRYFTDHLCQAVVNNGVYVRAQLSNEVIYYGVHVYDEEWSSLCEDATVSGYFDDFSMDESILAILNKDTETGAVLHVFGLGEKGSHFEKALTEGDAYDYSLIGVSDGRVYIGFDRQDAYDLISFGTEPSDEKKESIIRPSSTFGEFAILKGGNLLYACKTEEFETAVAVYDLREGTQTQIKIPEEYQGADDLTAYYEGEEIFCMQQDGDYVFDLKSGSGKQIEAPETWAGGSCFSDLCREGRFAVSDGKQILICDREGKVSASVLCPGVAPVGMTFIDRGLAALYEDGSLYVYDTKDGTFLQQMEATVYYNYSKGVVFDQDQENGLLYIQMGQLLDVIDLTSGVQIAHIDNCFGHQKGRDIFVTASREAADAYEIGYYPHYSVEQLIEKAKAIVQDTELSEGLKSRYGIGRDDQKQ
ncbi:MAG: TIR domain-containing protein [Lachnospiraceae bacterium]|nr:TIR domain-containing protein [Lachnospiraceae bacterium]